MDVLVTHICNNGSTEIRSHALDGRGFRLGQISYTYRACANISDFSAFNNIVQRPHNFCPGRFPIQSVNLQNINIGAETCDACIHGIQDVLAGKSHLIDLFPVIGALSTNSWLIATRINTKVAFTQDDHLRTRYIIFSQGFSDNFFRATIRVCICLLSRSRQDWWPGRR